MFDRDFQSHELMNQFIHGEESKGFSVDWEKVAFSILICIFGLIGNSMTMFVILVLREYKKSVTHWYVLQLAMADTIFLLTLPFKVNEDLNNQWIYPVWMCKAKEFILFLNYYASILFLMVMSIDRYIAVCHTFSEFFQKFRRPYAATVITLVTWLIASLLCTPFVMYSTVSGNEPTCKCEYEFSSVKVNYTEECIKQGLSEELFKGCLKFAERQRNSGNEESHCRKQNMLQNWAQELNQNTSTKTDIENDTFSLEDISSFLPNDLLPDPNEFGDNPFETPGELDEDWLISDNFSDGGFIFPDLGILENSSDNFPGSTAFNKDEQIYCSYDDSPPVWKGIIYFNFFGMFIFPLFVMIASYGLIISKLRSTRVQSSNLRQIPASGGSKTRKTSTRSDRDRRRVTMMCATLVLSFTLCWVLFHAVHLAKMVGIIEPSPNFCYTISAVGGLLGYLNSALNPYLYSFLGTNFSRRWSEATTKLRQSFRRSDRAYGSYYSGSKRKVREASQTAVTRMKNSQMVSEANNKSQVLSSAENARVTTALTT